MLKITDLFQITRKPLFRLHVPVIRASTLLQRSNSSHQPLVIFQPTPHFASLISFHQEQIDLTPPLPTSSIKSQSTQPFLLPFYSLPTSSNGSKPISSPSSHRPHPGPSSRRPHLPRELNKSRHVFYLSVTGNALTSFLASVSPTPHLIGDPITTQIGHLTSTPSITRTGHLADHPR